MKELVNYLRQRAVMRSNYFDANRQGIAANNLRALGYYSGCLVVLIVVLLGVAMLLLEDFRVTWHYLFSLGAAVVYFVLVAVCRRHAAVLSPTTIQALCAGFLLLVLGCCTMLDVVASPMRGASFVPVLLSVLPVLLVLPYKILSPLLGMAAVVFVALCYIYKPQAIAELDAFNSLFGLLAGTVTAHNTMELRLRDSATKQRYKRLGTIDALTGVYNRAASTAYVRTFLAGRGTPPQPAAFLLLDIDNFKLVNDRLGHQRGDEVLVNLGQALLRTVRSHDVVGRLGGDEFVMLVKGIATTEALEALCERIQNAAAALSDEAGIVPLGCSIGAVLLHGQVSFEELYALGDKALYQAKRNGKGCHCIVDV